MREVLTPGVRLAGPALVIEPHQTVVVEPGWSLEVSARDDLVLRRTTPRKREVLGKTADPVLLEVFNNLYMSIAEQMGEALSNTAQSVNIKERLDFSCAVFDAKGELVANAPHMPIHLGSMDRSVETVIRAQRGQAQARRRAHAERALQRRHAPARHHRHHAGVRRGRPAKSSSTWPAAATRRTSAAWRPAP